MGAKQTPQAHNYMSCLASLLDPEQGEAVPCPAPDFWVPSGGAVNVY